MQTQIELGDYLKQDGIERALNHANTVSPAWSDRAMTYFKEFLKTCSSPFMAENFREYAEKQGLEEPPSKRAFGGIMTRAKSLGWIKCIGFSLTHNPLAHRTPASLWIKA